MTSVERLVEYVQLPPEQDAQALALTSQPPPGWPAHGAIDMQHVFLKYDTEGDWVLRDMTCSIQPRWVLFVLVLCACICMCVCVCVCVYVCVCVCARV